MMALRRGSARIPVELAGDLVQTELNGFFALEHRVRVCDTTPVPSWWPEGAHISFGYRYRAPFSEDEVEETRRSIVCRRAVLSHVQHRLCSGPFGRSWVEVR